MRMITLGALAALSLAVAACGGKTGETNTTAENAVADSAASNTAATDAAADAMNVPMPNNAPTPTPGAATPAVTEQDAPGTTTSQGVAAETGGQH